MKRKLIFRLLITGMVMAGAALSFTCLPVCASEETGAYEEAGVAEEEDADEIEDSGEQMEEEAADEVSVRETAAPVKKKDPELLKKQVFTEGDAEGLIDDDGSIDSSSEGESLEEVLAREDMQTAQTWIPGFSVDPSRYPAANVTENTYLIYQFLTEQMLLNHAAACGVLANIQMEANFRPIALGDGGTSYGICQWHLGRFARLMRYCESEELDYNTIEGQLFYLQFELENFYPQVLSSLESVEDSEQGAYDAAYLFCMYFEMPDQTQARSAQRGNLAGSEFYPRKFEKYEPETEPETETETEDEEADLYAAGTSYGSPIRLLEGSPLGYETEDGIWIPIRADLTGEGTGEPRGDALEEPALTIRDLLYEDTAIAGPVLFNLFD